MLKMDAYLITNQEQNISNLMIAIIVGNLDVGRFYNYYLNTVNEKIWLKNWFLIPDSGDGF